MAATPQFKVYIGQEYVASVKDPVDGAAILAFHHGHGNTIRYGHKNALWTDGVDGWASESYDAVGFKVQEWETDQHRRWAAEYTVYSTTPEHLAVCDICP